MVRRSPQDKKKLSYQHDHRNVYGENDKSSRKAIPFRKRAVNKANRHADRQILVGVEGVPDPIANNAIDDQLHGRRRKRWRKQPDLPLGQVLKDKQEHASRKSGVGQDATFHVEGDDD